MHGGASGCSSTIWFTMSVLLDVLFDLQNEYESPTSGTTRALTPPLFSLTRAFADTRKWPTGLALTPTLKLSASYEAEGMRTTLEKDIG
jgi:hypothetical protein